MDNQESIVFTVELQDRMTAPAKKIVTEVDKTALQVSKANELMDKSANRASTGVATAAAGIEKAQDAMGKAAGKSAGVMEQSSEKGAAAFDKLSSEAKGAAADTTAAVTAASTSIVTATGKSNSALEGMARKHRDARHAQETAAERVVVAQKRLDELRERSTAKASQLTQAELNLAIAQQRSDKATQAAQASARALVKARDDLEAKNAASQGRSKFGKFTDGFTEKRVDAAATLAPGVAVAGGVMSAGFGVMLKTYADFDKSMSGVKAATHETTQNMRLMREEAIRVGADTAFSAAEAAGGMEALAKAGISTRDILDGGLDGAMALAAAGELDVANAAEIAATAMTQFKLDGKQLPHVADLLAAGAGKAQGSVGDLGQALNQAGLVSAASGATIEETTGTLAAFASAGLVGSDAGTSLKTMLQRLQNPAKKAAGEMEDLGINMYDSQGAFVGMEALSGQLATGMETMTQEQRDASMAIIFGSDAERAANVIYEQGADGIANWTNKVNDAGFAARTAAIMQDNLAGDLEKLGGSFDTVFLQSGSGANDVLRDLVQMLEKVVDWVGTLDPAFLSTIGILTGITGGTLLFLGALGMMLPKIRDGIGAIRDLGGTSDRSKKALSGIAGAAALAAKAIGALSIVGPAIAAMVSSGNKADPKKMADSLFKIGRGGEAAKGGLDNLDAMFTGKGNFFDGLDVKGIEGAFKVMANPSVSDNIDNALSGVLSFGTRGSSNVEFAKKNFGELDAQLQAMVSNGAADEASTAYDKLTSAAMNAGVPHEKLVELLPGYNRALGDAAVSSEAAAEGTAVMEEALDKTGVTIGAVIEDMEKFLNLLFATGLATMSARDANAAFHEATRGTDDAIKSATESLQKDLEAKGYSTEAAKKMATEQYNLGAALNKNKTDFDLTTSAGAILNAQFQDISQKGMADVTASAKEGMGQDGLQKKIMETYDALVLDANQMGITGTAAGDLARKVMGVPDDVKIESWMDSKAKEMAEETQGVVDALDGSKVTIYTNYKTAGTPGGGGPLAVPLSVMPGHAGGGIVGFDGGGIMPGYAPGRDSLLTPVSPGEGILTPEATRAVGPGTVMALNAEFSPGRSATAGPSPSLLNRLGGAPSENSGTTITIHEGAVKVSVTGGGSESVAGEVQAAVDSAFDELIDRLRREY